MTKLYELPITANGDVEDRGVDHVRSLLWNRMVEVFDPYALVLDPWCEARSHPQSERRRILHAIFVVQQDPQEPLYAFHPALDQSIKLQYLRWYVQLVSPFIRSRGAAETSRHNSRLHIPRQAERS